MAGILVVDDSPIARKNLKAILVKGGHQVVAEASNGQEAFVKYGIYKPDLITMDISMPRVGGIEAIKNILNKYPEAKIIMITALDQKNTVFSAIEEGAKHYILKPYPEEKVLEVVQRVLN